jgi:hypothetical protein
LWSLNILLSKEDRSGNFAMNSSQTTKISQINCDKPTIKSIAY